MLLDIINHRIKIEVEESTKMSKHTYVVEERSIDSRRYTVKSDRKLTESEITRCLNLHCMPMKERLSKVDEIPNGKVNVTVYYDGTDYGDDGQMEIVTRK